MPLHPDLTAPREHHIAGELGAVVADDHSGFAPLGDQMCQLTHDTMPRDRGVGHRCQTLSRHVIDHVEHPEPPAGRHLVVNGLGAERRGARSAQLEAPALVRQRQHRSRRYGTDSTPAAASSPHRQPFLLVEPLGLLAVDHHALPAQQDMQTAIAEPATLVGQFAQLLAQTGVIVPVV